MMGLPPFLSETTIPLKGEIAFTRPGDALKERFALYLSQQEAGVELISRGNCAGISSPVTSISTADESIGASRRYAEQTSPRRKTVEHTYGTGGIIITVQRGWAASERRSAWSFAVLGVGLRRYRLFHLLRARHPLWTSWQPRRVFRAAHHVGVRAAHPQVR